MRHFDMFYAHKDSQRIINHTIQWHGAGLWHDRFNGRLLLFFLLGEQIDQDKKRQFPSGASDRMEATTALIELVKGAEEPLDPIGGARRPPRVVRIHHSIGRCVCRGEIGSYRFSGSRIGTTLE